MAFSHHGRFPRTRMRRNRRDAWSRALVAENTLTASDFIWPIFVVEGKGQRVEIASMPGVFRLSVDLATEAVQEAQAIGVPAIALFPVTDASLKTDDAREAVNPDNLMCRAIKAIKKATPDIGIVGDVALDPYPSHGHDGLVKDGHIINDQDHRRSQLHEPLGATPRPAATSSPRPT